MLGQPPVKATLAMAMALQCVPSFVLEIGDAQPEVAHQRLLPGEERLPERLVLVPVPGRRQGSAPFHGPALPGRHVVVAAAAAAQPHALLPHLGVALRAVKRGRMGRGDEEAGC